MGTDGEPDGWVPAISDLLILSGRDTYIIRTLVVTELGFMMDLGGLHG